MQTIAELSGHEPFKTTIRVIDERADQGSGSFKLVGRVGMALRAFKHQDPDGSEWARLS